MKSHSRALLTSAFCASLAFGAVAQEQTSGLEAQVQVQSEVTTLALPNGSVFHTTENEVRDMRMFQVQGSDVIVGLWNEVTETGLEPFYAISLDGSEVQAVKQTSYRVKMRIAEFDPQNGEPSYDGSPLGYTNNVHIVQFETQPLQAYRDVLADMGVKVQQYIAYHNYVVEMDATTAAQVENLPFVRWVGDYHPEYRTEDYVRVNLYAGTLEDNLRYQIQLFEQDEQVKAEVANRIAALGGEVSMMDRGSSFFQVFLPAAVVPSVLQMDEVLFMDRLGDFEEDMDIVRQIGGADFLESTAGFSGQGVRGETADTGVYTGHQDFQVNGAPVCHGSSGGGCGTGSHGTNVHGIVFGSGVGDPTARGLLPDAQADYYCRTSNWTGSSGSPGTSPGGRYWHTRELTDPSDVYKCVFQTNSTGSPRTFFYTSVSAQMDQAVFDHDIIICQSQSNAGNQDSRPQAWGKNMVGVGGVRHQNTLSTADDSWGFGGSIGPANDGRIKPDLAHFYDNIRTTSGSSSYTSSFGGTSGATPCTVGYFGLFFQMWHNGLFGNPTGTSVFDSKPHFSTAKAALINSANQWQFSGAGHDLTRVHQGWGRASVENLYNCRNKMLIIDETDVLSNLQSTSYNVDVQSGEPAFKATMVYADTHGAPSSGQHRNNDLDLRVTAPNGTVYWGNNGLLTGMWSTSGGSANDKDTVENVFVQNPQAGTWVVEVIASDINMDTHVETGAMDADYALVVCGGTSSGACIPPANYCTPKVTSQLQIPTIGHVGTSSVSGNNFKVNVNNAVDNKAAVYFYGNASNNTPFLGGFLCVQPPISRGTVQVTNGAGFSEWTIDISGKTSGTDEYYQVWFRDPADVNTVGLTDGLKVTYCD